MPVPQAHTSLAVSATHSTQKRKGLWDMEVTCPRCCCRCPSNSRHSSSSHHVFGMHWAGKPRPGVVSPPPLSPLHRARRRQQLILRQEQGQAPQRAREHPRPVNALVCFFCAIIAAGGGAVAWCRRTGRVCTSLEQDVGLNVGVPHAPEEAVGIGGWGGTG